MDLRQGNSLQIIESITDGSVDLVLTSPPYDNLRTYNNSSVWSWDVFTGIAKEVYRVLRQGGVCVWIVGDATIKGSETGSSFRQALYFQQIGFNIHDTMIWNKGSFSAVGSLKTRYAPVFEYMFIFSKGTPRAFNPIKDRPNKWINTKPHGTLRQRDGTVKDVRASTRPLNEYGQRFNIWSIPPHKHTQGRYHPAPFPLQLAVDHIISWSNENDLVLDPFMGSGTTGVACARNRRRFIGMEIDPNYFDIAKTRIDHEMKGSVTNS
jgi:DNA modification methylase